MSKEGVTVGVRVRPLLLEEGHEEECVRMQSNRVAVAGTHRLRQFPFQYLLDRNAPQQQVFQFFALPLLEDLFKGHNCCLVAYGQNRSGKSFTVCGGQSEETKGVVPRIVDHLSCKLYSQETKRRLVLRVSYVQIWQEEIIDLLSIRRGVNVQVVESNEQTTLRNVQMKTISQLEEIETHFILGNRKRELAYSKKYRSSEQSTSVFTLYLESLEEGKVRRGKFDIIEMQANEVVSRFQPIFPNASQPKQYDLSAHCFKNVVNSLIYGSPSSHVPYGDSKVTQILRSALGGNSKTKILFHISPTTKCHDATISTLRTAAACQLIENTPSVAFDSQNSLIRQLMQQQEDLDKQAQAVQEELHKFDERKDDVKEQSEEEGENEFLSKSVLLQKKKEQRLERKQRCLLLRQSLRKQLQTLQSLFLTLQPLKNKHQVAFFKENYISAIERLAKNSQIVPPPTSLYESAENWSISETSFRKLNQRERFYKQEVYDLQREFQQQRELMLTTLREVTQRYKFYEKVAQRAVRPEEMELLRMNSKYDPTKRIYQVPLFAIRDKRVSHASRFFSPQQAALINSRAISQRKFMMTQLGASQHKPDKITEVKQIIHQENMQDNPYFQKVPRIKQTKSPKQQVFHRMSQDQYELVRSSVMSNRLKRKTARPDLRSPSSSSRSVKVKPILSPRFRFK